MWNPLGSGGKVISNWVVIVNAFDKVTLPVSMRQKKGFPYIGKPSKKESPVLVFRDDLFSGSQIFKHGSGN